jgi:hypothetical protein
MQILSITVLVLLAIVLFLDLRRHIKLMKSEKRIEKAEKEFINAIEDHLETIAKDSMEKCENGTCGHEDGAELKEISIVKVPVKSITKKTGNFKKKLTPAQTKEIEKAPFSITHRALALKYGVSEGRIGQIRRGAKKVK